MSTRRITTSGALLLSAALALAACAGNPDPTDEVDAATVTFRLWDEAAASAYEESFAAFHLTHPDILVQVQVVPWEEYWDRLPQDIAAGEMADVFWTNTANLADHAEGGDLLDLTDVVGQHQEQWPEPVTDLYVHQDRLWGAPQLWESLGLYYNVDLLRAAGVDPNTLRWDPAGTDDTLLDAALALTVDAEGRTADDPMFDPEEVVQFGFNAQHDMQALGLSFLAENGGQFQDAEGRYSFADARGEQSFGYLVDLVQTHHVAPDAQETNRDRNHARDLFIGGDLALFQSGTYALPHLSAAGFDWDLAPIVQGPSGRVSTVHAVAAVANAAADRDEVLAVMRWLSSAEGQQHLGEAGVGFPAARDAQHAAVEHWAAAGVDVQVFIEALEGPTVPAPRGARANAGVDGISPVLQEMFAGRIDVADALQQAQDVGNEALGE